MQVTLKAVYLAEVPVAGYGDDLYRGTGFQLGYNAVLGAGTGAEIGNDATFTRAPEEGADADPVPV